MGSIMPTKKPLQPSAISKRARSDYLRSLEPEERSPTTPIKEFKELIQNTWPYEMILSKILHIGFPYFPDMEREEEHKLSFVELILDYEYPPHKRDSCPAYKDEQELAAAINVLANHHVCAVTIGDDSATVQFQKTEVHQLPAVVRSGYWDNRR